MSEYFVSLTFIVKTVFKKKVGNGSMIIEWEDCITTENYCKFMEHVNARILEYSDRELKDVVINNIIKLPIGTISSEVNDMNLWTPVEDGLPKKDGWVFTTVEFEASENETQSYVMDLYYYSHSNTFVDNRRDKESSMFDRTKQVTAWKTMPEPYNPLHTKTDIGR